MQVESEVLKKINVALRRVAIARTSTHYEDIGTYVQ
jgi:hypothetical protein